MVTKELGALIFWALTLLGTGAECFWADWPPRAIGHLMLLSLGRLAWLTIWAKE